MEQSKTKQQISSILKVESDVYSLNKVIVKLLYKQQLINFLKSENQMFILNESQVQITRHWKQKGPEILANITRLNHQTLSLHHESCIKLSNVAHIGFYYLKSLYLENLELTSLQVFQVMNFRVLQQLWINNNRITSLRPFRKSQLPNLRCLSLNQFKAKDFGCLSQLQINKLGELLIDPLLQQWQSQKIHFLGANWLFKMHMPQLYSLQLDLIDDAPTINNRPMLYRKFQKLGEQFREF